MTFNAIQFIKDYNNNIVIYISISTNETLDERLSEGKIPAIE